MQSGSRTDSFTYVHSCPDCCCLCALRRFNLNTPGNGLNNGFGGNNGLLNPSNVYLNLYQYTQITGTTGNCLALRYVANSASPNGFHKQLVLYGGANTVGVANRPSNACVQQTFVNVLYNEIMFPSEYQNAQWTDTLLASPTASSAPSVAFNSPNALFTYRQYPTCAADVHSLVNHPSAPAQFVLGGWDANANVLASYDRYNGSNYASYSYVIMWNSASAQGGQFIPGRGGGRRRLPEQRQPGLVRRQDQPAQRRHRVRQRRLVHRHAVLEQQHLAAAPVAAGHRQGALDCALRHEHRGAARHQLRPAGRRDHSHGQQQRRVAELRRGRRGVDAADA